MVLNKSSRGTCNGSRGFFLGLKMHVFLETMVLDKAPAVNEAGYLIAAPRISRTGIQQYLAGELGLTDRLPTDVVNVYRPEDEVFSTPSMQSLAHMPVTIEHPRDLVDAKTWRQVTVGMTGGDVARDGDFIRVPLAVMDQGGIDAVKGGKVELSVGYTATLDFTAGTTPKGEKYDAVQRNIRGNHLAIVDMARGGHQLRVIDTNPKPEGNPMNLKKILVDGIHVEVSDMAAAIIEKYTTALDAKAKQDTQTIADLQAKLAAAETEKTTQIAAKDAEIVTLKQQVTDATMTPAKLDEAVKARAAVVDTARAVMATVVVDGKTEAEIRRQVVDARLGETAKGWTDAQVAASFAALTASVADGQGDTVRQHIQQQPHLDGQNHKPGTGRAAYLDNLNNAWKGQQPTKH